MRYYLSPCFRRTRAEARGSLAYGMRTTCAIADVITILHRRKIQPNSCLILHGAASRATGRAALCPQVVLIGPLACKYRASSPRHAAAGEPSTQKVDVLLAEVDGMLRDVCLHPLFRGAQRDKG